MNTKPLLFIFILILLMAGCVEFDFDKEALERSIFLGRPLSNRVEARDHDAHSHEQANDHTHTDAAETATSASLRTGLSAMQVVLVPFELVVGHTGISWKFAQDITTTWLFYR